MSKQQSSNTTSATINSGNVSLSAIIHIISGNSDQRIRNIDAECDKEIVAIQAEADKRIAEVQSEADREIARINERAQDKIRAIQAEANESIRKSLAEGIIGISKEIKKMGRKYQRQALKKCKVLTTEEFAAIVAEAVRAVRAKREKAGSEAIKNLGIDTRTNVRADDEEALEHFRKRNLEVAQQIMAEQKSSCCDPEGMD